MKKTILVTGSTDGIGLETAKLLSSEGHNVILHGRSPKKLDAARAALSKPGQVEPQSFIADLSLIENVENFAADVAKQVPKLDVLINNAGVFRIQNATHSSDGLDLRFMVNTVAPYILTKRLLPLLGTSGRVINLSSAAQSPVNLEALKGKQPLTEGAAYAQSKLALTMWSRNLGLSLKEGPVVIAVNPGSFLASKMVKEAYGVAGSDLQIGAKILSRAALSEEFATASGKYFDNDSGQFKSPHSDALDDQKCQSVIQTIESTLNE
ncbi:MAG: SDR family NAD(P)-dependent oxidoreductase [Planctomycetota bacterium]|nr:SDR family NAD(P)-dependent oxidoreductase [Planctomycetota bacterium]